MDGLKRPILLSLCLCLWAVAPVQAQVHVAVASNFLAPMRALAEEFRAATGQPVVISAGSTGKLYAQIVNGAPYDLFYAASEREPARLEQEGRTVAGCRYTYAVGILALWAPSGVADEQDPRQALATSSGRLALANPKVAPYGAAAEAVLIRWGLRDEFNSRIIRGENVAQAYQFAATGNAQFAFIALAQLVVGADEPPGRYWAIAEHNHAPIRQQAVMLQRAEGNADARAFWDYLQSEAARERITRFGYRIE